MIFHSYVSLPEGTFPIFQTLLAGERFPISALIAAEIRGETVKLPCVNRLESLHLRFRSKNHQIHQAKFQWEIFRIQLMEVR